jgi:hypothetical protein
MEYHHMVRPAIHRDLRSDLMLAGLAIAGGIVLAIVFGPEAGLAGGVVSAILLARYYRHRHRYPFFIVGKATQKWEEKKIFRNVENWYYYAEVSNPQQISKDKNGALLRKDLPEALHAEIFLKGYPVLQLDQPMVLCFTGEGVYLGFIQGKSFISYWD